MPDYVMTDPDGRRCHLRPGSYAEHGQALRFDHDTGSGAVEILLRAGRSWVLVWLPLDAEDLTERCALPVAGWHCERLQPAQAAAWLLANGQPLPPELEEAAYGYDLADAEGGCPGPEEWAPAASRPPCPVELAIEPAAKGQAPRHFAIVRGERKHVSEPVYRVLSLLVEGYAHGKEYRPDELDELTGIPGARNHLQKLKADPLWKSVLASPGGSKPGRPRGARRGWRLDAGPQSRSDNLHS